MKFWSCSIIHILLSIPSRTIYILTMPFLILWHSWSTHCRGAASHVYHIRPHRWVMCNLKEAISLGNLGLMGYRVTPYKALVLFCYPIHSQHHTMTIKIMLTIPTYFLFYNLQQNPKGGLPALIPILVISISVPAITVKNTHTLHRGQN